MLQYPVNFIVDLHSKLESFGVPNFNLVLLNLILEDPQIRFQSDPPRETVGQTVVTGGRL